MEINKYKQKEIISVGCNAQGESWMNMISGETHSPNTIIKLYGMYNKRQTLFSRLSIYNEDFIGD